MRDSTCNSFLCFMSAWDARLRAERLSRILDTRGLKIRACVFYELLPDPSRLRTRIDDEYKPACLAEDVGGGYMGNIQNCVSSSITNGTKSPVSPMIRPGLGPSKIHRCPCFLTRTCEKSILAEVGITQASLVPEVIKLLTICQICFYRRSRHISGQ